jgi:hypothetical protein
MKKTGADNRIKLSMSALNRSLLTRETPAARPQHGEERSKSIN